MNKSKFLIILTLSFFISTKAGICANSIKQAAKPLEATAEDSKTQYINKDWWDKFHDPILKGYVLKAVKDNYDLKIATLKVEEAQAAVKEYLGKEFPGVGLGLNYGRVKSSSTITSGDTRSSYLFPLTASYEIDLWGKNREATLGKKKELESITYGEKAAYISLCSTVAAVYFNAISTDRQIQVQKEIVDLRKNILNMTRANNKLGLSPTTDVLQADRAFTEAQSGLNDLQKQQAIFLNQLAVLTGESSDNSSSLKRSSIDGIELAKDLPGQIQSDVVEKRPDILKAEADLQNAKINVDLARKDFYPSFPIVGQFGFNAASLSKSFSWDSYIASFGAGLGESVFSGGQRRARLKERQIQYQQLFENYQKTILNSFQEVNDSLASLKFDTKKNNENLDRLKFERDNMGVINNQYAHGAISLLDTLRYKERVYSLEKEQIQSKTECLIDLLSLYKSTAGKL